MCPAALGRSRFPATRIRRSRDFLALGYNTSKSALNSMTIQFAKELKDTPIKVNAICPGYCATDINGNSGPRTAAQGAVAAIEYATIGDDGPTGGLFQRRRASALVTVRAD